MAELLEVDLIPKIISVDRKVRLSGIDRRRERENDNSRSHRSRRNAIDDPDGEHSEKQGTIDITV